MTRLLRRWPSIGAGACTWSRERARTPPRAPPPPPPPSMPLRVLLLALGVLLLLQCAARVRATTSLAFIDGALKDDNLGLAVANSGDYLAGYYTSAFGTVLFYRRSNAAGTTWTQVATQTKTGNVLGFGAAMSMSADEIAIGAPATQGARGRVFVHQRNQGGADAWGETKAITPAGQANGDEFGYSVALRAGVLAAGARTQGKVYVYRNSTAYAQDVVLSSPFTGTPQYGAATAVSDVLLLVGAPGVSTGAGAVVAYEATSTSPMAYGSGVTLVASDGVAGDAFGTVVVLSDDNTLAAVSAPKASLSGCDGCGAVYIFRRTGAGSWTQMLKLTPPSSVFVKDLWFGFSLAFANSRFLVVGAPGAVSKGACASRVCRLCTNEGAWIPADGRTFTYYRLQGGTNAFGLVATLSTTTQGNDNRLGYSISVSSEFIVAGMPFRDTPGQTKSGRIVVFQRTLQVLGVADAALSVPDVLAQLAAARACTSRPPAESACASTARRRRTAVLTLRQV